MPRYKDWIREPRALRHGLHHGNPVISDRGEIVSFPIQQFITIAFRTETDKVLNNEEIKIAMLATIHLRNFCLSPVV
jgi:hypothetical protein